MALDNSFNPRVVGQFPFSVEKNPLNIIAKRDPTTADRAPIGQVWINPLTNSVFILTSVTAGSATWTTSPGSGVGVFSDVTITGGAGTVFDIQMGDAVITNGDLDVTSGNVTIGGDLAVSGNVTVNGDFDITGAAAFSFTSTADVAGAITLAATGGTSATILLHNTQGTGDDSVNIVSDDGGITLLASSSTSATSISIVSVDGGISLAGGEQILIDSSQAAADAITLTASDAVGGLAFNANTGGMLFAAANGDISLLSGTGDINIGTDATGKVISIGSTNTTTGIDMAVGTGNFVLNGAASSTYAIGAATTTGTITIGGTAQTGTITLGSSTGAQTVAIAAGATGAKTVTVATGATANVVTIGSTTASASTTIQAGSGSTGLSLSAAGNVQVVPATGGAASPTASATINSRVGVATFTGFTTASGGGAQSYTINNSTILATSGILVNVANLNASTNDALIQLIGITQAAGSIVIDTANVGAGALGAGDNVIITFWVIS